MTWKKIAREKLRQLKRVDLSNKTMLELVLDDVESAIKEAAIEDRGQNRSVAVRPHANRGGLDFQRKDDGD
jgi:hypothetical protein